VQLYLPFAFELEITVFLVDGTPLRVDHWRFTHTPQRGAAETVSKHGCAVHDLAFGLVAHVAVHALAVAMRKATGGGPGSDLENPPLAAVDLVCVRGRPTIYEVEIGKIVADPTRRRARRC
jgi:hypothetical protein